MQYTGSVYVLLTNTKGKNVLINIESVESFEKKEPKNKTDQEGAILHFRSGREAEVKESPADIDKSISEAKMRDFNQSISAFTKSMSSFTSQMQNDINKFMRDKGFGPDNENGPNPDHDDEHDIGGKFGL